MMFADRCPLPVVLEAFAVAADAPSLVQVRDHLASCERCLRIVNEIREDAELLSELRCAAEGRLDPLIRERVLGICIRAGTEQQ